MSDYTNDQIEFNILHPILDLSSQCICFYKSCFVKASDIIFYAFLEHVMFFSCFESKYLPLSMSSTSLHQVKATPSAFVAFILDLPMLSLYCPTVHHMLLLHGRLFTRLAHGSTTPQVNGFTDAYVCSSSVWLVNRHLLWQLGWDDLLLYRLDHV